MLEDSKREMRRQIDEARMRADYAECKLEEIKRIISSWNNRCIQDHDGLLVAAAYHLAADEIKAALEDKPNLKAKSDEAQNT
jgi:hypothetical protein